MRLSTPEVAPLFQLKDSKGNIIRITPGQRTLLAFFRDTNCPFCNFRIFQLTQRYKELSTAGLEVIAFFFFIRRGGTAFCEVAFSSFCGGRRS